MSTSKNCPNCGIEIPKSNKFCSNSCAAIVNNRNRSKESRQKQARTLRENIKSGAVAPPPVYWRVVRERYKLNPNKCAICSVDIPYEKRMIKACSTVCRATLHRQAGSIGGRASAAAKVKRSKDEILLYDLCKQHFKNVHHNTIVADGWDADILIDDYKIAVMWNGPWHYKQLSFSNHSLAQVQNRDKIKKDVLKRHGWNVIVFEDRHYTPNSAFEELLTMVSSSFPHNIQRVILIVPTPSAAFVPACRLVSQAPDQDGI